MSNWSLVFHLFLPLILTPHITSIGRDLNAENQEVIAEQEKELKALRSKVKELEAQQSNNSR